MPKPTRAPADGLVTATFAPMAQDHSRLSPRALDELAGT
jgi:hypothetical protein